MKRIINFRIMPLILLSIILAVCTITFCSDSLIIVAVLLAVVALLCAIFVKPLKKARGKMLVCIAVFFVFMATTYFAYADVKSKEIYSQNSIIEGDVDMLTPCDENGELTFDDGRGLFVSIYLENITVDGRKVKGKANAVFLRSAFTETYKIGDRIKFKGDVAPLNFVVTDPYSMRNYRNGVFHYVLSSQSPQDDDFLLVKTNSGANLGDRIKLKVKKTLYSNTRSDTAGFLFAMTFGDKSGLDDGIREDFSYTGTAHVFAVSGLHVGMLAGALLLLFKLTKLKSRIAKISIVSVTLLIFSALCDFSPSTVRASLMTVCAMTAKALGLRNDSLSTMSLSACTILLFKPLYLFEMGFLMSFLAVVGIITLNKPILRLFKKLPKKLGSLLATSIAVNLALLPIMMYYFDKETLLFVIANLLLLPILGVCFPLYVLAAVVSSILPFMGWSVTAIAAPFTIIIKLVAWISELPTVVVSFDSQAAIIFLGILLAVALSQYVFADRRAKKITATVMCAALILTMTPSIRIWGRGNAYVYCFVDKYDCQYMFVDNACGGNYLIINDNSSSDTVNAVLNEMDEHKFSRIDGIIVVGDVGGSEIAKLRLYTACPYVYTYSGNDVIGGVLAESNHIVENGLAAAYLSPGCLDLVLGDCVIRVLANGYYVTDGDYDVLVSYEPIAVDADGKYIVCEIGHKNSLKNYVSGAFTFRINNDRIKVDRFWRY